MIAKRPFSEKTELPTSGVRLDFSVPDLGVEACEPISKRLQFFPAETFHLAFDTLYTAHTKLHSSIIPERDTTPEKAGGSWFGS